ncbi:AraC family transcriptional regulator [Jeongeupia sp. HS-3]|uniref:helix-turn-helix domain-containing protein n=1 Tax=Jeongeupia sp. HS-3 TaxID=1009682 RepID=UPI0019100F79|nr:AraC family transcriptional regulator [Jeongeupia sp. HS-3]
MDLLLPLSLRSYGAGGASHQHTHVQLVLPVLGRLDIEVGGSGGRLDVARGAFIAPDTAHAQSAEGENRFLVLDCEVADLGDDVVERLRRQTFVPISAATRRLIEFIDLACHDRSVPAAVAQHGLPLLLASLVPAAPQPRRLDALRRHVEARPGEDWSVASMAAEVGLSASRLHVLFRAETGQTPQAWLAGLRLQAVQDALRHSDRPIAQLALDAGYADQSALTRALRMATGETPAAFRKRHRQ